MSARRRAVEPAGLDPVDPTESSGPPDPPPDLRLVLPAVAAWLGAVLGTSATALTVSPVLRWSAPGLLLLLAAFLWRQGRRVPGAGVMSPCRVPAAALVCLAGGLGAAAVAVTGLQAGPVGRLAADRAVAEVRAVVTGDPRTVAGRPEAVGATDPLVLVPVRTATVRARGTETAVRSRLLVLATGRGWSELLPGQRITMVGRLGPPRPGQAVTAAITVRGPPVPRGAPSAVQRWAGDLRAGLRAASDGLPAAQRGLLPGLVVGDTTRVPAGVTEDFRTAGLTHLTAVSGANLVIVTGFVLVVGRHVGLRGRALPVLAALAMVGFVVLARPQPSVLRAAAMGAVALAALATGRQRRSVAALGATVVLLVLVDPWLARSYGFVLSVLATAGLVVLAPPWARAWAARGCPSLLAHALAVPVAAQLVCAPVVVLLSGEVSLVAVPANLLVAPAIAPATVLGVLATVASAVNAGAAALLAQVAGGCVWWVVVVAERAADVPGAAVAWSDSPGGALLLTAVTLAAVLVVPRLARRPVAAAAACAAVVLALVVPPRLAAFPPADWLVVACDVGQGDAVAVRAGPGRAVVVDAGPDPVAVDGCLTRLDVQEVPVVVLSHLHADHVDGLPGVLAGRRVGEVQVGSHDEPVDAFARVRAWTAARGVPLTRASLGDRASVGEVSWTVVWPSRVIDAGSVPNNASTVLLLGTRGVRVLLTGDVEPEAQRALLASGPLGPVDVLKVPHHGSAEQDPALVLSTSPRVALVSVGSDNVYGHPAPSALDALRRSGAALGRTDVHGDLAVAGSARDLRLVRAGR